MHKIQRARKKSFRCALKCNEIEGVIYLCDDAYFWAVIRDLYSWFNLKTFFFNWDTSRRKKMKIPGRSRCLNILKIKWCIDNKSRIIIFITYKISCSYLCFIFISFDHFLVNSDFAPSCWNPRWKNYDRCPCAVERKARIAMFTVWSV